MIALEHYRLRAALLIAAPPPGPGRAATARAAGDRSRLRFEVRLSPREIARPLLRVMPAPPCPPPAPPPDAAPPGERPAWTDPLDAI